MIGLKFERVWHLNIITEAQPLICTFYKSSYSNQEYNLSIFPASFAEGRLPEITTLTDVFTVDSGVGRGRRGWLHYHYFLAGILFCHCWILAWKRPKVGGGGHFILYVMKSPTLYKIRSVIFHLAWLSHHVNKSSATGALYAGGK